MVAMRKQHALATLIVESTLIKARVRRSLNESAAPKSDARQEGFAMDHVELRPASPVPPKASGLEGVVVADTRLSQVDGERGELVIAGVYAETLALAEQARFEDVAARLLELGSGRAQTGLRDALARARASAFVGLAELTRALTLPNAMDALLAATAQGCAGADALTVLGALPVYVAAGARLRAGLPPIAPNASLSHTECFLHMLGLPEHASRARALEAYWTTVSDHGLNASTFAARVVASTGSDVVPCILAALGALKGPLHGGAPGPVLDMLDATREIAPRAWLAAELDAGRRIMGMGHRIYRVRDPRALVFERALSRLEQEEGNGAVSARLAHARRVEQAAEALLSERHPDRPLRANVEFYTALLLEALGIPRELFTAVFAVGRCAGWLAHIEEQRRTGKLIRPAARYVGSMPE
jgi:citrate synthase